ncbi:MAG: hypothetical protein ACD_80C00174G0030 [uncultured bacterium (gcode 4)]|uniref:Uncharacterized protein n=1 Tax=uncultured bacterium (gcode 4) TaxID=1234023 RepID=K1X3R7_9BACT|nr:MAG: hypothetical protein ACD_80C00174G0030 [uncultured bacterium (gcode 4)]
MWVNKIIYVTSAAYTQKGLTPNAESQLIKVNKNVLDWKDIEAPIVFRTLKQDFHPARDGLKYLALESSKTLKYTRKNIGEYVYNTLTFLSNPADIEEVINSTQQWKTVVVGVTKEELKDILVICKRDWYDVVDKDKINNINTIYAVTISPNDKNNSSFFESAYGS